MEIKEVINLLSKRQKEIRNLRNLNARDSKFKSWHVSTLAILKNLPGIFLKDLNSFKRLTFTDTKYHRGTNIYNPTDIEKYNSDLTEAENILKRIIQQVQKTIQAENKSSENKIKSKNKKTNKID